MSRRCSDFVLVTVLAVAATTHWGLAGAQEFAPVVPVPLGFGTASLLDLGLPPATRAVEFTTGVSRPFGIDALATGTVMTSAGWRALRVAAGLTGSGDAEIGWNTAGAAVGGAGTGAGAAVRLAMRWDRLRDTAAGMNADDEAGGRVGANARAGGEIGVGGWMALGRAVRVWVAHPQLGTRGMAPPLRRGLDAGAEFRGAGLSIWLAREAAPRAARSDFHRAGLALGGERGWIVAQVREGPLRASVGFVCRVRAVAVAAVLDAHPVLGETTRLELEFGGERR